MKLIPYVKRPEFLFNLKENSEQVNYFKRCIYVPRVMFAGKHKTDLILKNYNAISAAMQIFSFLRIKLINMKANYLALGKNINGAYSNFSLNIVRS